MKVMVFDVPAENGGALSVLQEFYKESKIDNNNEYVYVLSLPKLHDTHNIKVLRFPWIKKSWIHRIFFDYYVAPKLIKKHKVDKVLSLQNIIIPNTNIYQEVFVHNAIPFSDYKFELKSELKLWVYQNLIGQKIIKSIKKADNVIVQTDWLKKILVDKLRIDEKKISVKSPTINIKKMNRYDEEQNLTPTFFYPASEMVFKNHKVIVEASLKLKKEKIEDYRILFTLNGDENKSIKALHTLVRENKLPIEFIGTIEREKVFGFYSNSILIFPSYIETVGLPLIEAKMHNTPIIAADLPYAHEVLGFISVDYFKCNSSEELSGILKKHIHKNGDI